MRHWSIVPALIAALVAPATPAIAKPTEVSAELAAAVASPHRSDANRARDAYRNPAATLAFIGVKPSDRVVEIWPSRGWYSEILAPYLADKGQLILAPPLRGAEGVNKMVMERPDVFGKTTTANFPALGGGLPVPAGSADVVLTFRNVHNWRMGSGQADNADYSKAAFAELYAMLKPGGVLGIEDHRLNENADAERERKSGYIKVSTVKALAKQAGFKFVGSSEINANSKDTKDYPKGVWTLAPNFAEGEKDRAKYAEIGESDRMTLKFMKPKKK